MEDDFDFDAALRSKGVPEEIGGSREAPEGTPSEEVTEEAAPERARDEQGRFAAQEEPQETEADTEAEKLLAGKYKSVEDLERAYQEIASKFGQQGTELGELRKLIEERLPEDDEVDDYPAYDPGYAGVIQQYIEAGRYQEAAVYAAQSGNGPLYNSALDAWYEDQPRAAAQFERQLEMQALEAKWQKEREPDVQARIQAEANTAWKNVADKYSDLPGLADKVLEAGQRYPDVLRVLQSDGGREGKERAIEALYKIAKADSLDTLSAAAEEAAQVASDEARRDKAESVVASASSVKRDPPRTKVEQFKANILGAEEISVQSGLTRDG